MALKQIFKRAGKLVDEAGSSVKRLFKTSDSAVIKTSSKMTGSTAKVVSGGQSVAKTTARGFSTGVSSTARVGGKVIAGTGIVAIPAAAGLYGLDKFKNVLGRSADYYTTRDENKNYADETDNLKDRIKLMEKAQSQGIDAPSNFLEGGYSGGAEESGSKMSPYALLIAAVAVIGIGAYAYSNKSRGGKK